MPTRLGASIVPIEGLAASAYRVPTDAPESDGTIAWDSTTLVLVEAMAGGMTGVGYSYTDASACGLIRGVLAKAVEGSDALAPASSWMKMEREVRNVGRDGIAATAISAVDVALWDLKAKLLGVALTTLLGRVCEAAPVYGSGGFTSYSIGRLKEQLGGWAAAGMKFVKMKIGTHPADDLGRIRAAREAIGPGVQLFVDANGAYSRKQALAMAEKFVGLDVAWFEEPVSSDDLEGLRLMRDRAPACMEIAAGEYGYDLTYFRRMVEAGAVDVLQIDATRAGGITGFLRAAAAAESFGLPVSAHCAPTLHAPLGCAWPDFRHLEYFHDHDRVEHMLFDGAPTPEGGKLRPDPSRPGLGIDFRRRDAERYQVDGGGRSR
ncbi:MAG TPA: enolase C-terminal domain-like protein [Isosphaeraceae bacterium]|nr:enolase C-terminal domain-like protein [Isosphaeraceae bacterium]